MIRLEGVNKTFYTKKKEIHALQNIHLEVEEGEIFGIIGHSGAGKSTLIRCMNLLENVTSGKVIVDGEELTSLNKKGVMRVRKKIGMIFQHFNLMPSRTVLGNVLFALKGVKLPKEEKRKKATELLGLVGLNHRIKAYPSSLSGGEKQRVAIARALANNPKVLLCDEATSALDPETTTSILRLLKEVSEKLSITIVLITHSMDVVKEICDRVAVIEGGMIKEVGDVVEVFSNPQSPVAKQFVAGANGINKVYDLITQNAQAVSVEANETLLSLSYAGVAAAEPLVYELSKKYDVKTNILFGEIDFIKGVTVGNMVVRCSGSDEGIRQAIDYIKEKDVQVKVVRT